MRAQSGSATVRHRRYRTPGADRPAGAWVAVALATLLMVLDLLEGPRTQYVGLLVAGPLLAASFVRTRVTVAVGLYAMAIGSAYAAYEGAATDHPQLVRMVLIALATLLAAVASRLRVLNERRMAALTRVAEVAQQTVLPPVPAQLAGCDLAVRYASASAEARIGGDLYEALDTEHGLRVLIGDVRGKGLDAVRLASHVLGSFRHVAYDARDLADVVAGLDRTVRRHSDDEDFVTAVVVQLHDGELTVLNCGHPEPLLVRDRAVIPIDPAPPSPPLGLGPDPVPVTRRLAPAEVLLLYTDGLAEARSDGRFLPLHDVVRDALSGDDLEAGVDALQAALLAWVRGRLADDVALVALRVPTQATAAAADLPELPRARDGEVSRA